MISGETIVIRSLKPVTLVLLFLLLRVVVAQSVAPNTGGNLEWSPDGTELAILANNGVFIYDRNFQLLRYREASFPAYWNFDLWSPDGTRLLILSQVWDAATLETLVDSEVSLRGWLADGHRLFNLTADTLQIRNALDGSLIHTIDLPFQIEEATASPDGTKIALGYGYLVDLAAGDGIYQTGSTDYGRIYAWSPDSTQIAYISVLPADHPSFPSHSVVKIIDRSSGKILRESEPLNDFPFSISWSVRGPFLAGLSKTGRVFIWETRTLQLLNSIPVHPDLTGDLDLSPFGGIVAVARSPGANDISPQSLPEPLSGGFGGVVYSEVNQIIDLAVPVTTHNYLQTMIDLCTDDTTTVSRLIQQIETRAYLRFRDEVIGLTEEFMPGGCRADLIAVAEAIIAQGE